MTYEFIHPAQCMNSYVSDPCLVHKKIGHWWRWWGGEWSDRGDCECHIGPWFKSPKPGYIFVLANLANFHVAAILAISTYIKPNI